MQNIFDEVASLDARAYEKFSLNEDILMEHAANGMALFIRRRFAPQSRVIILSGSGNNGADGLTLARLLHKEYTILLLEVKDPSSPMAQLQKQRIHHLGITTITTLQECEVLVDAVVGTGFRGEFDPAIAQIITQANQLHSYKIACDVPSGLRADASLSKTIFKADTTLTMGGLKKSMFLDQAKDYVGEISVINLGIAREFYEVDSPWKLLEYSDLILPKRKNNNTHKGSYGHLALLSGDKTGASILSACAALRFGAGLVTLITKQKNLHTPYSLMSAATLPHNTTAIACGMGLGEAFSSAELTNLLSGDLPLVLDADIFYSDNIHQLLQRGNTILTPHPKEFVALLETIGLATITIEQLQAKRCYYVELFCSRYKNTTLLLKGSNVIIGHNGAFFINPYGSATLAKGGSGDVLSGLIGALLAQNYPLVDAAICASLAHTKLAQNYTGSDFSLIPEDLIEGIGDL
jgi:hydroxyethylthiazole kinase-like uncharacterized protein yjeF